MLIVLSWPERRSFITSDHKAAAELCGRHPHRSALRRHPIGWEAGWIEPKTLTWCLNGSQDDAESAKEYAKVNRYHVLQFPPNYDLDLAHQEAGTVAMGAPVFM